MSPSLDHRWDRLRMEKTVSDYARVDKLRLEQLVTHVKNARRAQRPAGISIQPVTGACPCALLSGSSTALF